MKNKLFELLKPQNVFSPKRRLGAPHEDGGYVMVDYVFENCVGLFSYGIGNDTRFEEDFSTKYNKPSYMFDHTEGSAGLGLRVPPDEMPRYTAELERLKSIKCNFFPEGLGTAEHCKDFHQHYEEQNINGRVLLKIDVEGYEYDYFLQTDMTKLESRVMGMIIEFHWIKLPENEKHLIEILTKLDPHFILCHIHGNNWGGLWEKDGHQIPETIEVSFINRNFVEKYEPDEQDYPIKGLDVSNHPYNPDYELTFLRDNYVPPKPVEYPIDPTGALQMSVGDVVDRYNICRLKQEKGNIDSSKEIHELSEAMLKYENILPCIERLYELNSKIWDLEADIRAENEAILGLEEIGKRALQIRDLNAVRNDIKKEIDLRYNEGFVKSKEPSVILSLTTVPERLADTSESGIIGVITSICEQNDIDYEIHFNIPEVYNITKAEYIIPEWLIEYQSKYHHLKIFRTEDYGPPTKFLPTLQRIKNPETILVVVDDDLVYHPDMIFEHRKYQEILTNCAICYDGRDPIPQSKYNDMRDCWISCVTEIRRVEMVQHYKSISYKKKLFNQDFYDYYVGRTFSDDALISTFFKNTGVRMFVVPYEKELSLFLTIDSWNENLGVTTFPVIRHSSSVSNTGCNHPGLLALPEGGRFYMPDNLGKKE